MLPGAGSGDEDPHRGLPLVAEATPIPQKTAKNATRGLSNSVDSTGALCLESAFVCDSLMCSPSLLAVTGTPVSAPREGVFVRVAEVKVQEGESIESALRRFKRKVQQEDIIKDIKKHSFYLKPGDKRRAKQALARKRNRKKMRRELE
jgi:small subunit ribosomal protein S21